MQPGVFSRVRILYDIDNVGEIHFFGTLSSDLEFRTARRRQSDKQIPLPITRRLLMKSANIYMTAIFIFIRPVSYTPTAGMVFFPHDEVSAVVYLYTCLCDLPALAVIPRPNRISSLYRTAEEEVTAEREEYRTSAFDRGRRDEY